MGDAKTATGRSFAGHTLTSVGRAVAAGVGTGAEMVEGVEVSAELAKELVKGAVGITQGFGTQSREIGTRVGETTAAGVKLIAKGLNITAGMTTKLSNYVDAKNLLKQIQHEIDIKAKNLGKDELAVNKAELEIKKQKTQNELNKLKTELEGDTENKKN